MASRRGGSFATYAASSTANGHDTANDFMRLSQAISNNIQKINQNVKKMYPLLDQYGTPSDSVETHDKLHEIQHYTNQLAKDTNNYIKDITHLQSPAAEQRQQKLQRERLVNEFTRALTSFQEAQRQEKAKEKTCAVKATPQQRPQSSNPFAEPTSDYPSDYHDNRGAGAAGQQQIALQVDSSDVDMEILHEREEAIRKLEADITDVNQIFKDLGLLVHEQGEVVDSIESNVETAATHVEQGTQELHQASKYQSAARKKKCIIITIIVVVIAVIIIIIVVPSVMATKS